MEKELLNTFDKELLLKDICARLPYGVKINTIQGNFTLLGLTNERIFTTCEVEGCHNDFPIECIKPYLFPLSSMTEEQKKYITDRWGINDEFDFEINPDWGEYFVELGDIVDFIDWLNKNHFDYRCLIEKGLAIDVTGLNIY